MQTNAYIKELELQNFMCHRNFKIALKPTLNIIHGTNGSGKSTILTAIMVGLGSRANITSRGTKLSTFILTGEERAWITIKIHIPTEITSLFTEYGNEVTIVRILDANGTSRHVLYNHEGKKVRNSKSKDVSSICNHCEIFPSNELAMLSQENAKEFLVNSTPQAKYKKLEEGMLQPIIQKYNRELEKDKAKRQQIIERYNRNLMYANDKEQKCREILSLKSNANAARKKLDKLNCVKAWKDFETGPEARYKELYDEIKSLQAEIDNIPSSAEAKKAVDEKNVQLADLDSKFDKITRSIDLHAAQLKEREDEYLKNKEIHEAVNNKKQEIENSITEKKSQLAELEAQAQEFSPEIVKSKRETYNSQLSEKRNAYHTIQADLLRIAGELSDLSEDLSTCKENLSYARTQHSKLSSEKAEKIKQLQQLKNGKRASSKMVQLNNLLKSKVKQTSWKYPVKGPLYDHVKIEDSAVDYLPMIEQLWNESLGCWWVQCNADRDQLNRLAAQVGIRDLHVINRQDDAFRFEDNLPPENKAYIRLYDVFTCDEPSILRIFVDRNSLESTVLVRGNKEAFSVTHRKIKRIFTTYEEKQKQNYMVISTGVHRETFRISGYKDLRIKVSSQSQERFIQGEIDTLNADELQALNRYNALKEKTEVLAVSEKQLMSQQHRANSDLERINFELNSIQNKLNSLDDVTSVPVTELSRMKHEIEVETRELDDISDSLMHYDNLKAAENHCNQLKSRIITFKQKLDDIKRSKSNLSSEIRQINLRISDSKNSLESLTSMKDSNEALLRPRKLEMEDARVNITRTLGKLDLSDPEIQEYMQLHHVDLKSMVKTLESELNIQAADASTIRLAEEELEEVMRKKKSNLRDLEESQKLDKRVSKRSKNRAINQERVWQEIKHTISTKFKETLHARNFTGELVIDDSSKKLITTAGPDSQESRTTSTLSGGEKSFVQVALLMSVWSGMDVKLTALDEYDVYMDKFNRAASLELLAKTIKERDIQCILITPQDVDTNPIKDIIDFSMLKLSAAQRN